ncbi:hypothetical protein FS837_005240 [Tulasnella sp. UAMH 9824]|nr:hypothetical protein FS837_005240 [Tulasnella sp. UAMH 9824]
MHENHPNEELKPNTPSIEEGIRQEQSPHSLKECSPVKALESVIDYRIDKRRIRPLDTGTSKRGASAEVEPAVLLPQDVAEPLSMEKPQYVAVKKLNIGANISEERVLRSLARELGLLNKLSHENIVLLIGFVENISEGVAWMIFPWEANGNIREFLQSGDWEIPERISLANILVSSENRALITDFGSARLLDRRRKSSTDDSKVLARRMKELNTEANNSLSIEFSITDTIITVTGPAWTLRWAAPEVLDGELPNLPSDIWAFGWICWEIMTNSYPFADVKQDAAVVLRVVAGDLPSVENNVHTSQMRALCHMMSECWNLDPDKRPSAKKCMTGTQWMTKIIPSKSSPVDGMQSHSAALLKSIGQMHIDHGRVQQGITDIQRALDIFRSTNDNEGVASTLCILGEAYVRIEEDSKAKETFAEASEISLRFAYIWHLGRALSGLAKIYNIQGDTAKAKSFLNQVMNLYTRLGTELAIANANYELGIVCLDEPNYEEAEATLSKAYTLYTSIGADLGIANAAASLGQLLFLKEDDVQSTALFLEAQSIYERIGETNGLARVLWYRAKIREREERYAEALALVEEARKIYLSLGVTKDIAVCHDLIQVLHNKMGKMAGESLIGASGFSVTVTLY